ncbi:hypothetical protein [Paraburkholderia aromaticivorans]|uniref:hypothetical protein n=1 Tax=Paraburkholderia aromaticivorans TaxID=2026199 RepID=UPI001455E440|nr:hypothetical protein [Paraburkholderia aromaticivorans]
MTEPIKRAIDGSATELDGVERSIDLLRICAYGGGIGYARSSDLAGEQALPSDNPQMGPAEGAA